MNTPPYPPETQRFADLNDAVAYAPRSRMTILRALRQGGLPGSHAGRTSPWVIKWVDLIEWVDRGCPVEGPKSNASVEQAS